MKYRKSFGWAKSLAWLVGEGEENDKGQTQAQRIAFLERRNQELQNMDAAQLRAKIAVLEGDLQDQREKHRKALETIEKEKVSLTGELETYKAFGKPEELKTKLETLSSTTASLEQYRMAELVSVAAKTTRLDFDVGGKKEARAVNAEKLTELVHLHKLKLEMKDGTMQDEAGKPVKASIAHVLLEDGKSKPLSEYLSSDLSKFVDWVAEAPAKPTTGTVVVPQPTPNNNQAPPNEADILNQKRQSDTYQM
jgi:hypothetical protein